MTYEPFIDCNDFDFSKFAKRVFTQYETGLIERWPEARLVIEDEPQKPAKELEVMYPLPVKLLESNWADSYANALLAGVDDLVKSEGNHVQIVHRPYGPSNMLGTESRPKSDRVALLSQMWFDPQRLATLVRVRAWVGVARWN